MLDVYGLRKLMEKLVIRFQLLLRFLLFMQMSAKEFFKSMLSKQNYKEIQKLLEKWIHISFVKLVQYNHKQIHYKKQAKIQNGIKDSHMIYKQLQVKYLSKYLIKI